MKLALIMALALLSCTPRVVAPPDESGSREAVISHDYNGDGERDVYAIRCTPMLDGAECAPEKAWTCGVVVLDGVTSDVLYERGLCLHRVPDSFGARNDNHQPVIKILDRWYEIGKEPDNAKPN